MVGADSNDLVNPLNRVSLLPKRVPLRGAAFMTGISPKVNNHRGEVVIRCDPTPITTAIAIIHGICGPYGENVGGRNGRNRADVNAVWFKIRSNADQITFHRFCECTLLTAIQ